MSQPRRCFLLVRSERDLYEQTAFSKDLRLTYTINRAKKLRNLHSVSCELRGKGCLLGRPRDRLTHSLSSSSADEPSFGEQ